MNTEYTTNIICPYCGHEDKDSWDELQHSDSDEIDCGECFERFIAERHMIINYSTFKLEKGGEGE